MFPNYTIITSKKINIKKFFFFFFLLFWHLLFYFWGIKAQNQLSLKENIILYLWLKRIARFWASNIGNTHFHTLFTCQLLIEFYWQFLFYLWSIKAWRYNNQLCLKENIILHLWLKSIARSYASNARDVTPIFTPFMC